MNHDTLADFTSNIKLSGLRTSLKLVKTIFGDVKEKRVAFCFDISGSMYRVFHHFREHILETLLKMLLSNKGQKFNIIVFNSSVHQFSKKLQNCIQENIINVIKWMNKSYYESKSNILGGLIKSFEDFPDAVYLVTDGFINKDRSELLKHLPHISKGRPVKCIMITHKIPPDDVALDFLEDIVTVTNGTLTIILIQDFGAVEVVMPILYNARPPGVRRCAFNPFVDEKIDLVEMRKYFARCKGCLNRNQQNDRLDGDPMEDLPVIAPFIGKDPISEKRCPFYHPYFHWYWPQYWDENGPSPTLMWTKNDPQYHSMWKDFRESRVFTCGKKYLHSYNDSCLFVSAASVLINRKVLTFNYREEFNIYIGTVTSRASSEYFLVRFDVYEEFNETQKTHINELIDLEEQKRHSIKVGDFVIAPLTSGNGAHDLAVVIEGNETRSGNITLVPIKNTKLKVKFLESNQERYLEFNQAYYVSPKVKENIENLKMLFDSRTPSESSNDDKMIETSLDFNRTPSSNQSTVDFSNYRFNTNNSNAKYYCNLNRLPCFGCCGIRCNHKISGRVASPVDDGNAKTLEEIDSEIQNRKQKINETEITNVLNIEKEIIENQNSNYMSSDDDEDNDEDNKESKTKYINFGSNNNYYDDGVIDKREAYTETDLNWCILQILNKQNKSITNADEKKSWKYWGKKPIPDIIDPPSTEPYKDPSNWGGCPMPKPSVNGVEWPTTTFQTINPHVVTDYSPDKMYRVFQHESHRPSQRPSRDVSVGVNNLSPEENCQINLEKRFRYLQGGYPKLDIKYPNVDSVKPLLTSWSTLNPQGSKNNTEKCLRSIEKSRIDAQIQRDESNCINYLNNKNISTKKRI